MEQREAMERDEESKNEGERERDGGRKGAARRTEEQPNEPNERVTT